jgi:hypothetical protein
MKWLGLSLTRTFDISMVLCAKQYFNCVFDQKGKERELA